MGNEGKKVENHCTRVSSLAHWGWDLWPTGVSLLANWVGSRQKPSAVFSFDSINCQLRMLCRKGREYEKTPLVPWQGKTAWFWSIDFDKARRRDSDPSIYYLLNFRRSRSRRCNWCRSCIRARGKRSALKRSTANCNKRERTTILLCCCAKRAAHNRALCVRFVPVSGASSSARFKQRVLRRPAHTQGRQTG